MDARYANTHLAWVFRKIDRMNSRKKPRTVAAQPSRECAEELGRWAIPKEW